MVIKPPNKIQFFSRADIKQIMFILEQIENEYKDEAVNHTPERQLYFLSTARGASIAKKRIKEFFRSKYNIVNI